MIIIIAIPNLILPIMTFQFNVVVDHNFATETDTLNFFGVYRGIISAALFVILMFSGRVLSSLGVSTSLLFHPINYLLAFLALLFRFDIITGIYANFSTSTLKQAINNPARAVLYNFFPSADRAKVKVFLRGTVVKASSLLGAGMLMALKDKIDPRLLTFVALPFVLMWIITSFIIKKRYPSLLIRVLMDKQIDWRKLEDLKLDELTRDRRTIESLRAGLKDNSPEVSVLCGEILSQASPRRLGRVGGRESSGQTAGSPKQTAESPSSGKRPGSRADAYPDGRRSGTGNTGSYHSGNRPLGPQGQLTLDGVLCLAGPGGSCGPFPGASGAAPVGRSRCAE